MSNPMQELLIMGGEVMPDGAAACEAPSMLEQIRASTEYVSWFPVPAGVRADGGNDASTA